MCGLCGFVYKDAARTGAVGRVLHGMLAADGPARYRLDRHRPLRRAGGRLVRAACAHRVQLAGRPSACSRRSSAPGGLRNHTIEGPNLRARLDYDGDLGDLTDQVEAEPHVEVFSIGRSMEIVKEVGDANDVERSSPFSGFEGSHAIGHTRMATESVVDVAHSHPFWARPFPDISVVHNGHITNYHKLRRKLENQGHRFATGNDSEAIAVYIADKLAAGESLEDALRASVSDLDGTFSYLISTAEGIGCARDRFALKPLLYTENDEIAMIASEEVAIRSVDGDPALEPRELAAGEVRWWLR